MILSVIYFQPTLMINYMNSPTEIVSLDQVF